MNTMEKDLIRFKKAIKNWTYENIIFFPSGTEDKNDITNKWSRKDERDTKKWFRKDRKELTKIYNLIRKNDLKKAGELAVELDTVVRDEIPRRLYNKIDTARCED